MSDESGWCTCRPNYGQTGGYNQKDCPVHDRDDDTGWAAKELERVEQAIDNLPAYVRGIVRAEIEKG